MKGFKYCPNCQSNQIVFNNITRFDCPKCGFEFYKNVAAGVVGIYTLNNKILFQIRSQEPSKGKLDAPGGFINPGETAEEALSRETFEEIGLNVDKFTYLGTAPNQYEYKGILYEVCDIIFHKEITEIPQNIDKNEVQEVVFISPENLDLNDLAFESIKTAIELYLILISS